MAASSTVKSTYPSIKIISRVEPVAVCDQSSLLVFSQLKHKIRWEAFNVTPYLLVQTLCLHPVQHGNVTVYHDLMTTDTTNKILNVGLDAAVPRLGRVKIFSTPMRSFPPLSSSRSHGYAEANMATDNNQNLIFASTPEFHSNRRMLQHCFS